ncbi:MAG: DedA family protein [Synergistaceae bacterium]|nr:DedA family protein [Synergistaceae bacterium]
MKGITNWLVATIGKLGYTGIVALMFLESSFFPFPSEVVLPPAGYLAWRGEMSFVAVVAAGITGSILGALFNYWFALKLGRPFLVRYGRYFFVSEESIKKAETFFERHGHISTLVGRLLPVIRQYISLPAGVARMKLGAFTTYTSIGAGAWVVVLVLVGYLLGEHQELLERYLHVLTFASVANAILLAVGYLLWYRHRACGGERTKCGEA